MIYFKSGHTSTAFGLTKTGGAARAAMGIDWTTRDELGEAIPPAFSEFLARQITCDVTARHNDRTERRGTATLENQKPIYEQTQDAQPRSLQ